MIVGSGLVFDNGSGGNVNGNGTRMTPSIVTADSRIYIFKSGTGTVAFWWLITHS